MHHHHHRRRKKRPNYGTRTVEVSRALNGFGFTISGQQPCILSCIVANSPADLAGLRAGDFLISVNGLNVSKLPHEAVVQLIGNSPGTIRMQIAENYFSDSSDDENVVNHIHRIKPRYLHHKLKMNRLRNSPQKGYASLVGEMQSFPVRCDHQQVLRPVIEDIPLSMVAHSLLHSPRAKDISNVSAMVRRVSESPVMAAPMETGINCNAPLEYRAVVGYLGTIEMPKQIATSSKLQTVRSCIRKMRQEKRNPTTVLMTILPHCLTLKNSSATILAKYPASRLNYVSSSSESENRFFGLVTSAIYATLDEDPIPLDSEILSIPQNSNDIIISNSCHVFVVDTKICDHIAHEQRTAEFHISCTKDPISNLCLEFPNNSEYVVNLIRSMYTMKVLPPSTRAGPSNYRNHDVDSRNLQDALMLPANSPQPSNHSEVTTTSSNSDSGIGFHNDCTNISDRIVVVDFPGLLWNRRNDGVSRPVAICNNLEAPQRVEPKTPPLPVISHAKSKSLDLDTRLTVSCVRAMPDPKVPRSPHKNNDIPDLLAAFRTSPKCLITTRSCDDVITSVERNDDLFCDKRTLQMSIDDITMLPGAGSNPSAVHQDQHVFLQPRKPAVKKSKKLPTANDLKTIDAAGMNSKLLLYKLSPKVFGMSPRPTFMSFEDLTKKNEKPSEATSDKDLNFWGSLQDLHNAGAFEQQNENYLNGTYSEPDLGSRALPSATSPFRRWGQSSFRTPKSSEPRTPLARRPSSLAASESDVYSKSVDDFVDDLDSYRSQSGDLGGLLHSNDQRRIHQRTIETGVVSAWGNSFEKLLDDAAGLHTFAEFLKKEFSAENIYFWTACERYRQIENDCDRAEQAIQIFAKHLAIGAPEPVNVDSQARNTAEDHLPSADRNLFSQAQKQIFNLMKFDSYQRFIRSELYKRCLEADSKNQPLPYPGEQLDELLKTNLTSPAPSKLKKSLSNAEDRRRKSLLPWHRKVRCKSRDRGESDFPNNNSKSTNKSQLSGNNTLRPPATTGTTTSTSDIHSSRSSLSSFDAAAMGPDDPKIVSLCRVILCDGATTIVQTRQNETVRQLVERLLEKRGIHYQFFDVILNTNSKAIDLENPATMLAGKEVQIEQRVAFKLDLPDPKVISVKSKPKKALCDVLKPILHKYNYRIEDVQVLLRETQEPLEMNLPVTAIDGQRLQVVMLKQDAWSQDAINQLKGRMNPPPAYKNQIGFQSVSNPSSNSVFPQKNSKTSTQQNTLDEITNKVFNELLQGKVDSHSMPKASDQGSLKSEECASESSSIFGRLRRRDSNTPGIRLKPKKLVMPAKSSTAGSEDGLGPCVTSQQIPIVDQNGIKKPLIAKWKTGVKLQSTGRTENQEEFLEGLKRAQRARLEDQRGTEINSELPDFLKDKENLSIANKLRKTRPYGGGSSMENGEGQHSHATSDNHPPPAAAKRNSFDSNSQERPQPAPRLSITTKGNGVKNLSPVKVEPNCQDAQIDSPSNSITSTESEFDLLSSKGPPPLPPKPKILPIKPSNWGHSTSNNNISNNNNANSSNNNNNSQLLPSKIPVDISRRHINSAEPTTVGRNVYFDQPSSSFV